MSIQQPTQQTTKQPTQQTTQQTTQPTTSMEETKQQNENVENDAEKQVDDDYEKKMKGSSDLKSSDLKSSDLPKEDDEDDEEEDENEEECIFCLNPHDKTINGGNYTCDCDKCGAEGGCFDCVLGNGENNLCPTCYIDYEAAAAILDDIMVKVT